MIVQLYIPICNAVDRLRQRTVFRICHGRISAYLRQRQTVHFEMAKFRLHVQPRRICQILAIEHVRWDQRTLRCLKIPLQHTTSCCTSPNKF